MHGAQGASGEGVPISPRGGDDTDQFRHGKTPLSGAEETGGLAHRADAHGGLHGEGPAVSQPAGWGALPLVEQYSSDAVRSGDAPARIPAHAVCRQLGPYLPESARGGGGVAERGSQGLRLPAAKIRSGVRSGDL